MTSTRIRGITTSSSQRFHLRRLLTMFVAALPLGWRLTIYPRSRASPPASPMASPAAARSSPSRRCSPRASRRCRRTSRRRSASCRVISAASAAFAASSRAHRDLIRSLLPVVRARHRRPAAAPARSARPSPFAPSCRGSSARAPRSSRSRPLITKRLAHVDHDHPARRWGLFVGIFLVADLRRLLRRGHWGSCCSP